MEWPLGPETVGKLISRPESELLEFKQTWPDGTVKSNFLCNIGYGDPSKLFPRSPRLSFDEVCKVL